MALFLRFEIGPCRGVACNAPSALRGHGRHMSCCKRAAKSTIGQKLKGRVQVDGGGGFPVENEGKKVKGVGRVTVGGGVGWGRFLWGGDR